MEFSEITVFVSMPTNAKTKTNPVESVKETFTPFRKPDIRQGVL